VILECMLLSLLKLLKIFQSILLFHFEGMGSSIVHCGGNGTGQIVKLCMFSFEFFSFVLSLSLLKQKPLSLCFLLFFLIHFSFLFSGLTVRQQSLSRHPNDWHLRIHEFGDSSPLLLILFFSFSFPSPNISPNLEMWLNAQFIFDIVVTLFFLYLTFSFFFFFSISFFQLGMDAKKMASIFNTATSRCWSCDSYNPVPGTL